MCSIDHDALREDDVQWMALPVIRPMDASSGLVLLMRNCTECHSTLAREMPPQGSDE